MYRVGVIVIPGLGESAAGSCQGLRTLNGGPGAIERILDKMPGSWPVYVAHGDVTAELVAEAAKGADRVALVGHSLGGGEIKWLSEHFTKDQAKGLAIPRMDLGFMLDPVPDLVRHGEYFPAAAGDRDPSKRWRVAPTIDFAVAFVQRNQMAPQGTQIREDIPGKRFSFDVTHWAGRPRHCDICWQPTILDLLEYALLELATRGAVSPPNVPANP